MATQSADVVPANPRLSSDERTQEKISPAPSYEHKRGVGDAFESHGAGDAFNDHDIEGKKYHENGVEEVKTGDDSQSYIGSGEDKQRSWLKRTLHKIDKRYYFVAFYIVMTGWWIAGLVLHRHRTNTGALGWLKPTLLWLALTVRVVTLFISTKYVTKPVAFVWTKAIRAPWDLIPQKMKMPFLGAVTVAVMLIGTFASAESEDNTRANRAVSLFGLAVFIAAFWATSRNRKAIQWQTVIVGMLAQYILALFVLRTKLGYDIFNFIAFLATTLLGFAAQGTLFLTNQDALDTHMFIVGVVPPIIFFIAFVQLLYYWGVLQWFIKKFATVFFYSMKVSGAEAVVAAASPFVGQGESAMLIKPFIAHLTDAELHQIMTSGFATIAGSVLAVYISFGISPLALVSSCVMSIPASLAISKLRYPEEEEPLTAGKIVIPKDEDERPTNSLHAFANGSWLGIKVAGMIVTGLLCILALLGLVNALLGWWGKYLNITAPLSIDLILGYIFFPVAFLLGVDRKGDDIYQVAKLIGTKVVANEFVAFQNLSTLPAYANLTSRSRLIATYAVCGFGNISSVGIQIGVLTQLAPSRGGRVAKVAISALISGVIATLTSASIAGMIIVNQDKYTTVTVPS